MKITYDNEANAIYLYLTPKKLSITNTLQPDLKELYFIDMHDTTPVGVEILNASTIFNKNNVKFLGTNLNKKTINKI